MPWRSRWLLATISAFLAFQEEARLGHPLTLFDKRLLTFSRLQLFVSMNIIPNSETDSPEWKSFGCGISRRAVIRSRKRHKLCNSTFHR
ncbi:hypothetical protein M501DRAFT_209007 [Patellaria atrata CBS 101060]|uniref:Secreted protein n=1 Tax=Patellaria atrata CBS 101060 TaxID=1346257 RepID=A0A9P4S694_9PEZI|nr:hypothetical protein M501DRAFT_209007 [Patellaria atrata CBS 101060]